MNCPTRVDPVVLENGWNQNPSALALAKNSGSSGIANRTYLRDHRLNPSASERLSDTDQESLDLGSNQTVGLPDGEDGGENEVCGEKRTEPVAESRDTNSEQDTHASSGGSIRNVRRLYETAKTFAKFMGPGWMIAVAYIDPGNYATDAAAGTSYKYQLLVMILVSNVIAIFLQSLCVKLGSVTGMNLAENCKAHFPRWLNIILFVFAYAAVIATDIAEVIGTAIALYLLSAGKIPLVAGCAISIADVLIILFFYRPSGGVRALRIFEYFVGILVLGVVICFCIQLSYSNIGDVKELFRGYAPSSALVQPNGLLQACGILGATVMPHSLYLGSGLVQSRLQAYDEKHENKKQNHNQNNEPSESSTESSNNPQFSIAAIRHCMKYSVAEVAISLFTFALFVNSSILIVVGASLNNPSSASDNASLFAIHSLLNSSIGSAAGTIFALALLLSGISAGIVCTLAGQMIWLGQLQIPIKPWLQRLLTRSIAITPSILIAGVVGKEGVSAALEGSQIALSALLPFVSAPLIWFTCRGKYMSVRDSNETHDDDGMHESVQETSEEEEGRERRGKIVNMKNNRVTASFAVVLWLIIVIMNIASWVLQGIDTG